MKKRNIIILFLLFNLVLNAQTLSFGKFPSERNQGYPILTSNLLKLLNWDTLKRFSDKNEGHYCYERKDSLLIKYEYVQQGRVADFEIISYKGKVLEYKSEITNTSQETNTNYFDKNIWLEYAHNYLQNLPDSLKLSIDEPKSILKAYYRLLGVGADDEYGWICEYSTVGMATDRRVAVIRLLGRKDLLWKLLEYQNIYTQLYIADALIYLDLRDRKLIKKYKAKKEKYKTDLDFIKYLEKGLLSKTKWNRIYLIRDSNQSVNTCKDGTGSYKIYMSTTNDLLSEEAIKKIPNKYEELIKLGYMRF